jgi:hypothetical protein
VHTIKRRPIGGNIGGQSSADRIDAEGKEPVQLGLHTLQTEDTIPEQIPIERFEVSDIKDNAVALRDRPLVEEIIADHIKELVALAASPEETVREFAASLGDGLGG